MIALLADDAYIRISFSCSGPLDRSSLPSWILVLPRKKKRRRKAIPIYSIEGEISPTGLFEMIEQRNCYHLQQITVREKRSDNHGTYSVLNFVLTSKANAHSVLLTDGTRLLQNMLLLNWMNVEIFFSNYVGFSQVVSISFSKVASDTNDAVFLDQDAWGIRRAVQREDRS